MASRVVGLDIGTHGVRAAEIILGRGGSVTLARFGQVALPPRAVVAGEVAEPGAVAFALKRLWREAGFSTRKVILGVGNQRVVVRPAELPEMDADDLRSAIEFQADELIPIPLDEAILDFQQLERVETADGEPLVRVLVVAAQREMVASLLESLDGAGLEATMIDIVPFALLRSLADADGHLQLMGDDDAAWDAAPPATDDPGSGEASEAADDTIAAADTSDGSDTDDASDAAVSDETSPAPGDETSPDVTPAAVAEAIVDVGAGTTTIVVHEYGVPKFIRTLMIGGADLNTALSAELDLDHDEAESLKRQVAAGAIDDETAGRAAALIDDRITPLVEEIQGSLDYHLAQQSARPLRRVVLTGAASRLPRIAERLRSMFDVPVETGDPLASVEVGDTGLSDDQLRRAADVMAVPLGLALAGRPAVGDVRRLNLLPPEIARQRRTRRQAIVAAAAIALLIALLGLLWAQRRAEVDDRVARADAEEAVTEALRAELTTFAAIQTLEAEVDARRALVRTALENDVTWTKIIQEVATVMPDDTWLASLNATAPQGDTPGAMTVAGNGFDHTSSARWLIRLDPLPSVDRLWLQASTRTEDEIGVGLTESTFTSSVELSPAALSDRELNYLSPADADADADAVDGDAPVEAVPPAGAEETP